MKKQKLIEALQMLARGRIDAAEAVADLLMPDKVTPAAEVYAVQVPDAPKAKKAK